MWRRTLLLLTLLLAVLGAGRERRTAQSMAVMELPMEKRYAALTFDDGPHPGTTDRLLDGLKERGTKATFFLVGEEAAANRDLTARIAAEGHQIGNHTWSHRRLELLSEEEIVQEVGKTDALLRSIMEQANLPERSFWLRPPYGGLRAGTEALISVPMVKWSVDPRDWESRDADQVVRAVLDDIQPNSIVILHDIYDSSVDAALRLADLLPERGYELVTVEELLWRNGVVPEPGTLYLNGER